MESRASGEKIIDYRSSSSTRYIYIYKRKEKFSFVHRRESRKVGTVRGQNYWTGLSLRNLFLSPPSHIHRLTLEGFSKFRFKAVPMKNPRIRTVPRYLAYKMFPPTVLEGNVPRDFHAPPPPPRDHPSFFPFPERTDRSVQIYRFVWIEGEKARRRGWEKMVSQNGRGLRERERERRGESFSIAALTIVRIARYRSPRFIVGEIYVKCIEGLGHFYSIEIMSTSQLLCSPHRRLCADRELSRVIEELDDDLFSLYTFRYVGNFRAKEERRAPRCAPMSRFDITGHAAFLPPR